MAASARRPVTSPCRLAPRRIAPALVGAGLHGRRRGKRSLTLTLSPHPDPLPEGASRGGTGGKKPGRVRSGLRKPSSGDASAQVIKRRRSAPRSVFEGVSRNGGDPRREDEVLHERVLLRRERLAKTAIDHVGHLGHVGDEIASSKLGRIERRRGTHRSSPRPCLGLVPALGYEIFQILTRESGLPRPNAGVVPGWANSVQS